MDESQSLPDSDSHHWSFDHRQTAGRALFDPDEFSDRAVRLELHAEELQLESIAADLESLEDKLQTTIENAVGADSDAVEDYWRHEAAILQRRRNQKEAITAEHQRRRGVVLALLHGREAIETGAVDIGLAAVIDGADAPVLADSIHERLKEAGLETPAIREILQYLEFAIPPGLAQREPWPGCPPFDGLVEGPPFKESCDRIELDIDLPDDGL